MSGWSREEALGQPISDVLRIVDRANGTAIRNVVEVTINEDKTVRLRANCKSCVLIRRDALEFGVEITVAVSYTHLDVYKRQPLAKQPASSSAHSVLLLRLSIQKLAH